MDSERAARLILFSVVGVILVAAVGFIGFGYWYTEVRPDSRTVLKADDAEVTFAAMKRRMKYEYSLNPQQFSQFISILPDVSYESLLSELTLVLRAEGELGITATPEEIDAQLRRRLGVQPGAGQREFIDSFRDALDESGLKESEYRRIAHADVLLNKIREKFTAELPATVPQSKVEMISATEIEAANQARERVVAGQDWATVAREVSKEVGVQENGGQYDYQPDGGLNDIVNGFAFEAEPGEISEPLSSPQGQPPFYIVRVVDRSEQPLRDEQKVPYVSGLYEQWLIATQAKMNVERHWAEGDYLEAFSEIDLTPPEQPPPPILPSVTVATPAADATAPASAPTADPAGEGDTANPTPSGAPQPEDGQ
ncbi:MAG: peptidylprolyl isomerase [Dehalococcoidia bacterium]